MELGTNLLSMKKDAHGKGQHPVLVKIDNDVYLRLKITAKHKGLSINRAINMAIFEFNSFYCN